MPRFLSASTALVLIFGFGFNSGALAASPSAPSSGIPDSELYVGGKLPPVSDRSLPGSENPVFESNPTAGALATFYQRDIARWKDPTTLPHTRTSCISYASGSWPWGGGWKTCNGWKTESQWLYNTATLTVTTPSSQDIKNAVEQCLLTGAVVAGVAAIVSGGSAAVGAFDETLKECLVSKIGSSVSVNVNIHSNWGGWE